MAKAWRKIANLVELLVACVVAFGSIRWFQAASKGGVDVNRFQTGIIAFYLMLFAVGIALTALFYSAFFSKYFHIAYTYLGRALGAHAALATAGTASTGMRSNHATPLPCRAAGFIFVGALLIRDDDMFTIIIGCATIAVGVVWGGLQFVTPLGHPSALCFAPNEPVGVTLAAPRSSSAYVPPAAHMRAASSQEERWEQAVAAASAPKEHHVALPPARASGPPGGQPGSDNPFRSDRSSSGESGDGVRVV